MLFKGEIFHSQSVNNVSIRFLKKALVEFPDPSDKLAHRSYNVIFLH